MITHYFLAPRYIWTEGNQFTAPEARGEANISERGVARDGSCDSNLASCQ